MSRDDSRIHRLSSFLLWEGNLEAKTIHQIKKNIFYVEAGSGKRYILKGHANTKTMKQQWEFFEKIQSNSIVPFVRFPNGKKDIPIGSTYTWTLSPYISGRKLNYKQEEDRNRAVKTIKRFHHDARGIPVRRLAKKQLFYKRWRTRLGRFTETEGIFTKYGYTSLFKDIANMMQQYIDVVSNYPWQREQLAAERNGIWVHGDVASHNFIQADKTYLIDFDLLHATPQIYDMIQLGQRFLPHIQWDAESLLRYQLANDQETERFLYAVFIPSDVVREWLHYLSSTRRLSVETYLKRMEEEWEKRKKFLTVSKQIVTM